MTSASERILLAYLAQPKYGGWVTFTCHLARGLHAAGYTPVIVKNTKRTEKQTRDFGRQSRYQNLSTDDLIRLTRDHRVIITAVDKHHHETAARLIETGATIVIHDPTELKQPLIDTLDTAQIIVIRESMKLHLPRAEYIPHPYMTRQINPAPSRKPAVALSRIDFDKHTDMIIEANKQLDTPIAIYGFMNPIYSHFKLDQLNPHWKNNYYGTFAADNLWSAVHIASQYDRVIDMSIIKGDGGGTQYTHLEAANAQTQLILHSDWKPTGLLAQYAQTCSTADELAELCSSPAAAHSNRGADLLKAHDAKMIARQYIELLTGS